MIVVVVGNEGSGKTTLATRLRREQFQVRDHRAVEIQPMSEEEIFLILDVPIEIVRQRLQRAGRNLEAPAYTTEALTRYREHYLEAAGRLPHCRVIDATNTQADIYAIALNSISSLAVQRHRAQLSLS